MSSARVPAELRRRVSAQARHRCGYCLSTEAIVGTPMELDHIIPEALGGETVEDNLWLSCSLCNGHKGDRIAAVDPASGDVVRLFDPRRQAWADHFRWTPEGDHVVGTTPSGRATVIGLNLNRPVLARARRSWVTVGWHPPRD